MSNDQQIALLTGTGANMPAFAKQSDGAALNKEAIQGTGGESINRISLKQSRFRLIVGGEQVSVVNEPHIDVVVVRTNPSVSKAYYARKYDPNAEDQSPDCYSSNGVVPDPDAQNKQCDTCAACPMNVWGSKISEMSGAKIKACSDVKRIAIVPASNVRAPMFQIGIPAASLTVWGNHVRMLNQATPVIPYNGIVTRISFDPDSDYPRLLFSPLSWITDEQYQVVKERHDSEEAKAVTTTVDAPAQLSSAAPVAAPRTAAPKAEPKAAPEADPWAQATQAAEAPQPEAETPSQEAATSQEDAFAKAGWSTPSTPQTAEPPTQKPAEAAASVVEAGSDLDTIFGAGFDD